MNSSLHRATRIGAATTAATAVAVGLAIASAPVARAASDGTEIRTAPTTGDDADAPARHGRLATLPFFGARLALTTDGVVIAHIVDDSPAEEAGLAEGDLVMSVNGVALDERGALREALQDSAVGDEVTVDYVRGPSEATATVTLGDPSERPEPPAAEDVPWLGASLVRYEAGEGVLVRSVQADGPADDAGLKAADVVTSINGEAIDEFWQAREVLRELAPGDKAELTAVRDGETVSLSVTLGSAADATVRPGSEHRPQRSGEGMGSKQADKGQTGPPLRQLRTANQ